MTDRDSEDKNHLAMLAVPVILSLLIGFSSGGTYARANETRPAPREDREVSDTESRDTTRYSEASTHRNDPKAAPTALTPNLKQKLEQAVLDKDYQQFRTLTAGTPFGEIMTQTAFAELVTQYNQHVAGYRRSPFTDDFWLT